MDKFLRDFQTIVKILKWREPSLERYDDPVFLNGFKRVPIAMQRQKAREIFKSVKLVNLANTLKFLESSSELSDMLVNIITTNLGVLTSILADRQKKIHSRWL